MQDQHGVPTTALIEGSKHRDGSIYRQDTHFCHSLYRLYDTTEKSFIGQPRVGTVLSAPLRLDQN
ncbi:hypothetical protein ACP4OV_009866 [Aristida adscensionis]